MSDIVERINNREVWAVDGLLDDSKHEIESLRKQLGDVFDEKKILSQRVQKLEDVEKMRDEELATVREKHGNCLLELAALKQSQGEPYGYVWFDRNMECRFSKNKPHDEQLVIGLKPLYTSAPTIPEGWQLVRSTITPEVSLRMDELRDADTTNEYLYEVIIAAAAAHKTEGMQLVSDARLKELEEYEFMYKSVSK